LIGLGQENSLLVALSAKLKLEDSKLKCNYSKLFLEHSTQHDVLCFWPKVYEPPYFILVYRKLC